VVAVTWSEIQRKRLLDLDADDAGLNLFFDKPGERDKQYQVLEKTLVKRQRARLQQYRDIHLRPRLLKLETRLTQALLDNGFVQVTTPIIMARGLLAKMTIGDDHPLAAQVYWLGKNQCLRPMLAPHLYYILKDLLRLWEKPVSIFEIGPCFRKETQGAKHASEFTMLNLTEFGLPMEDRSRRLRELAKVVADAAQLKGYDFETEKSEVYGETLDVVGGEDRIEVGSGAMGPHPLDRPWKIAEPWVGIGFGLERLLMVTENEKSLAKMGRSLTYLDGIRLNI